MTRSIGLVVLAGVVWATAPMKAAGAPPPEPSPGPAAASDVLALIGGEPYTAQDLEQAAGPRLFQARSQEYQARRQILDEEIDHRLLDREAASRQLTIQELLKQEVAAKVAPVTPAEQKAYYDSNKGRIGPMSEADAFVRIEIGLRQQRTNERQLAFLDALRVKAGVRVLLDPPRLQVDMAGDDPSRGPADAPVTMVEFSDFQCPFCARAMATLKKLDEAYPGKIRLVYRDFPIVQIHPHSARASEAAGCARDQGKFWAMHDAIFGHQDKLEDADLKKNAADIGLDAAQFAQCLDSGRHRPEWEKDAADGERYGISSTPAFFINGRLLVGAQPYENFARLIDEELAARQPPPAGK
jgi:protein-disulfide isomerase